ncbi:hypothetical protein BH10ACI2_BH10ACI2_15960 [soil metagenome]
MDQEKWQKAKDLFHEAQNLAMDDRAAFLEKACAGDTVLLDQVENLLGAYESGFMEEPVVHKVAEVIGRENELKEGQVIGRYQIERSIGVGGMGEVFLADDTELDRPVAFKFLHRDVAEDPERVRRFIQEARAASALNHPNILTIHEIGTFEGANYIVSEFINGETLRERMQTGLTVAESLDVAAQVAAALQAAHEAGIVHRDIKPENIMLRRDGLVKVLDFGLAKLTEADDHPIDPSATVSARFQTSPGLVMGTAAYMSPEQAKGQAVDARTDLWSLGVVLHEMLTGKSPFEGETVTELITSILKKDSPTLDSDKLPQDLRSICTKALTKDKQARYQSSQEFINDLQGEKKKMEYAIHSDQFISVSSTDDQKTQLIRRRPTLSAEYIVSSVKRHKYATLLTAAAAIVIGGGVFVYKYNGAPRPDGVNGMFANVIGSSTTETDLRTSRIPSSGKMSQVAISPDGKYIAYVTSDGPGKEGLRLRQLETSSDVEIVPAPSAGDFYDISFSPDASQIYFRHAFPPFTENTINRISRSGGSPTKLVVDVESGTSLSPDGKMLAFSREVERRPGQGGGDAVILAQPDGSNERVLSYSGFDAPSWLRCGPVPAWTPDGKSLACYTSYNSPEGWYFRLTTINVTDGSTKLRDEKWSWISGAVYMPDGSLVIVGKPFSAEQSGPAQLWLIAPNGQPKSITSDVTGYSNLSSTRNGDVLLTIQSRRLWDLWKAPVGDVQSAIQVTNSGDVDHGGTNWTQDGRILFSSNISGNSDIWIMNADGSGRKQLTKDHYTNMSPTMSADGRYIVFISTIHDGLDWHVFRMDADGTNLKQLTNGFQEYTPRISPDGKWVYFMQYPTQGGPSRLCKAPINGGEPIVLATAEGRIIIHDVSPNGSVAYEDMPTGDNKGLRTIKIIGPSAQPTTKTLQFDASTTLGLMQWSADGRYITFQERKKSANFDVIAGMSLSGKRLAKPLVSFTYPIANGSFSWSKDGKNLTYGRITNTSDAIMITSAKQ